MGCHSFEWHVDAARRADDAPPAVCMDLQLNAKTALHCGSIRKHWYHLRVTSAGMLRAQLPHGICSCAWVRWVSVAALICHAVPAGSADSVELVGDICGGGGGVAAAAAAASIAAAAGAEAATDLRSHTLAHTQQRSRHAHAHTLHTVRHLSVTAVCTHVRVLMGVRGEARSVAHACMSVRCHPCEMRCTRLSECRAGAVGVHARARARTAQRAIAHPHALRCRTHAQYAHARVSVSGM